MDNKDVSKLLKEIAKLLDTHHDININYLIREIKTNINEQNKGKKKQKAEIKFLTNNIPSNKEITSHHLSMPDEELKLYFSDENRFPTTRSLIAYASNIGITISSKLNRESTIRAIIKHIEFSKIDQSIRSRSTKP